jgi:hypothetical protein
MTTEIEMTATTETPSPIQTGAIRWPEKYLPAKTHVFASNEIVIRATPEVIWAWLILAEEWPSWYPNSKNIHFRSISGPNLRDRARFAWTTFGIRVFSKVLEFEPYVRLAWESQGMGVHAYHTWLLMPLEDGSTHVITQETQVGWLSRLVAKFMPTRVQDQHKVWLEGLSRKALGGPPVA